MSPTVLNDDQLLVDMSMISAERLELIYNALEMERVSLMNVIRLSPNKADIANAAFKVQFINQSLYQLDRYNNAQQTSQQKHSSHVKA